MVPFARVRRVRGDYQLTMQAMDSRDQLYQFDEQKSLRQINVLLQNWEQEQAKVVAPASIPLYRWRPPVWSYAAAAMVAMLIGFCFWWANNSPVSSLPDSGAGSHQRAHAASGGRRADEFCPRSHPGANPTGVSGCFQRKFRSDRKSGKRCRGDFER